MIYAFGAVACFFFAAGFVIGISLAVAAQRREGLDRYELYRRYRQDHLSI